MIDLDKLTKIDTQSGLNRVGGDLETYELILRDYVNEFSSTFDKLSSTLSNDFDESIRILHTFKGVSGSIGSVKLFEIAKNLELKAKEKSLEITAPELDLAKEELNEVLIELKHALIDEEKVELSRSNLINKIKTLNNLLGDKNYKEAKTLANEIDSYKINFLGPEIEKLIDLTKKYKIKEAIQLSLNVLKELDNG